MNSEIDNYQLAAELIKEQASRLESNITPSSTIEDALELFKSKYSPEILETLDDNTILPYMFYTTGDNTNALCCWIEMNPECRTYFGSISGGSAFKFGLFQKRATGEWVTGSSQKPKVLSEQEALEEGKRIRDALVKGVRIIQNANLDSLEAYEQLDDDLRTGMNYDLYNLAWIHKYFSMICSDKLSGFHSETWQRHVLRSLKIKPSEKYYARSGQIALVQKSAGLQYRQFFDVFKSRFGGQIKSFVRLGSTDVNKSYASEWASRGVIGLGWSKLGDLSDYVNSNGIDQDAIKEKLNELYYPDNSNIASNKATEIARFYKCDSNTVFVVMDGERLVALADNIGAYFYEPDDQMAHLRPATWKFVFDKDEKLPIRDEGKLKSCYVINKEDNLSFLYEKYYYTVETEAASVEDDNDEQDSVQTIGSVVFHTGYESAFSRNRIVFGAPGTGKSYTVNSDSKGLLGPNNEDDYERVTFHPDYTYANFVGTYKPVPAKDVNGNDIITYAYVPGPFMRIYVKALKNSRTGNPKPFLLIIEEINRANVAAVFGDVFQLLDRGDDNVSEYPIQASEDIRNYLAAELGISPEECSKIRIPDNMFIWATMNSADQGVFPMDTAFKRRWDFTYLGINDSDTDIQGKYVVVGTKKPQKIEWNKLRKAINNFLAEEKINEDKQLGPYFIARKIVVPADGGTEIDSKLFCDVFKHKVLMYLFDDAAKQKRSKLFAGCTNGQMRYSSICEAFDVQGIGIFNGTIQKDAQNPDLEENHSEDDDVIDNQSEG